MNEPMQRYLKVGAIHFMSYPECMKGTAPAIPETLRKIAADDYFDIIEVTWIKDNRVREHAKKIIDESGIQVSYGAQPRLLTTGLNPNDLDEEGRTKAEASLLEAIDEAEYLGAKAIAFLSGKWEPAYKDEHYAQLLKTTRNLCAYAKTRNMSVELEVFDFDLDKKSLIGPAPYAAAFAADMRTHCNNFGLLVDLSHLPQTYESAKFAIQVMKPYITHFHIGSAVITPGAPGFGDSHPRFNYPNSVNGVTEVLDFLKVMKEEGFFDPLKPAILSFEIKPQGDEDSDLLVANCKRVLNRAWALL